MGEQFPTHEPRGARVTISLKADAVDYNRLQVESKLNGIHQSDLVHILLELMRLRLESARSNADLTVEQFPTDLEAFVHLVAADCGLISGKEKEAAAWAARNWVGAKFDDRAGAVFGLLAARFGEKYGPVDFVDERVAEPFEPDTN